MQTGTRLHGVFFCPAALPRIGSGFSPASAHGGTARAASKSYRANCESTVPRCFKRQRIHRTPNAALPALKSEQSVISLLNHAATIATVAGSVSSSGFQWELITPTETPEMEPAAQEAGDIGDLVIQPPKYRFHFLKKLLTFVCFRIIMSVRPSSDETKKRIGSPITNRLAASKRFSEENHGRCGRPVCPADVPSCTPADELPLHHQTHAKQDHIAPVPLVPAPKDRPGSRRCLYSMRQAKRLSNGMFEQEPGKRNLKSRLSRFRMHKAHSGTGRTGSLAAPNPTMHNVLQAPT